MNSFNQQRRSQNSSVNTIQKNAPLLITVATLVALGLAGAFFGYRRYTHGVNERAQKVLQETLELFQKEQQEKTPQWQRVIDAANLALSGYSSSAAAGPLYMLQADAYSALGDHEKALQAVESSVSNLSSSNALKNIYKTKQALMLMDGTDEQKAHGLSQLEALAHDRSNINNDEAQYYLGLYYWVQNNVEKARTSWADLAKMPVDQEGSSIWARRAQSKLANI